jgi:hypothetical protein
MMLRSALIFSVILIAYDALAALSAKWIAVSYDSFVILALVLLFFMGVYAGRRKRSWGAIVPIVIAASIESTAGWYVAAAIGPGYVPGWTMRELTALAIERAVLFAAIGAAGVWTGLGVSGVRRGMF